MTKCNQCRFDKGSNFCSHCGRITDQGRKVGAKPPCACEGREPLADWHALAFVGVDGGGLELYDLPSKPRGAGIDRRVHILVFAEGAKE